MKILIHQPRLSYYLGGGEIVPLTQAKYLSQFGHEVTVLTSKPNKYSDYFFKFKKDNKSIRFVEIALRDEQKYIYNQDPTADWSRWDKEAIYFGQATQNFYSQNHSKFDLVITHLLSDSLFIPRRLINVLHLHGVPNEYRAIDDILLDRPDHFISVSRFVKKGWINLYPKLKGKNIKVIHNGIDTSQFPNKKGVRNVDLLFVGRFLKNKGVYQIIEAVKILEDKNVNWNKLLLIGKGAELQAIKKLVNKHKFSKKVKFMQDLSSEELLNYYNKSKTFLCPSYAKEGVLTTMLEAASAGCVIITANACGMPEFAKDNYNSLLVKPQDSNDLAKKIEAALTSNKLSANLVSNAQKTLNKNWNILKKVEELFELYKLYAK